MKVRTSWRRSLWRATASRRRQDCPYERPRSSSSSTWRRRSTSRSTSTSSSYSSSKRRFSRASNSSRLSSTTTPPSTSTRRSSTTTSPRASSSRPSRAISPPTAKMRQAWMINQLMLSNFRDFLSNIGPITAAASSLNDELESNLRNLSALLNPIRLEEEEREESQHEEGLIRPRTSTGVSRRADEEDNQEEETTGEYSLRSVGPDSTLNDSGKRVGESFSSAMMADLSTITLSSTINVSSTVDVSSDEEGVINRDESIGQFEDAESEESIKEQNVTENVPELTDNKEEEVIDMEEELYKEADEDLERMNARVEEIVEKYESINLRDIQNLTRNLLEIHQRASKEENTINKVEKIMEGIKLMVSRISRGSVGYIEIGPCISGSNIREVSYDGEDDVFDPGPSVAVPSTMEKKYKEEKEKKEAKEKVRKEADEDEKDGVEDYVEDSEDDE